MKNKKKIVAGLVAIVLLIGSVIGATLAWFTDSDDSVKNTFVVGNVEIVLYESSSAILNEDRATSKVEANAINATYQTYLSTLFNAEGENGASNFVPGYTVAKNAYVSNIGTVDSWIGATYSIPTALVTNGAYKGIDVEIGAGWTLVKTNVDPVSGLTTYSYVYDTILDSGAQAGEFIKSVSINKDATNETENDFFHKLVTSLNGAEKVDVAARTFDIDINAYAIQAPSLVDGESNAVVDADVALNIAFPALFDLLP